MMSETLIANLRADNFGGDDFDETAFQAKITRGNEKQVLAEEAHVFLKIFTQIKHSSHAQEEAAYSSSGQDGEEPLPAKVQTLGLAVALSGWITT